ncbi:hypothetical protein SAMN02745170_02220 [Propionispora hippei DSM 15287]|uniref:Uncharacterized protein n=1 Tax=Propionispora hippei DSM 15287 TaxID=1123003 RepID=A0A1M6I855_9FIRM|nr:hypothetical protein SAMN02745170_02220 [Propionispora hippei DSM 15287]
MNIGMLTATMADRKDSRRNCNLLMAGQLRQRPVTNPPCILPLIVRNLLGLVCKLTE